MIKARVRSGVRLLLAFASFSLFYFCRAASYALGGTRFFQ